MASGALQVQAQNIGAFPGFDRGGDALGMLPSHRTHLWCGEHVVRDHVVLARPRGEARQRDDEAGAVLAGGAVDQGCALGIRDGSDRRGQRVPSASQQPLVDLLEGACCRGSVP